MRSLTLPALALLLLAACTDTDFRAPALHRTQALARTEPLEMRVVKVWDVVASSLDHDREPGVSHYVEVDVLSGSSAGQKLTLPLDDWICKPPVDGAVVVAAPADWVKQRKGNATRPFGGW